MFCGFNKMFYLFIIITSCHLYLIWCWQDLWIYRRNRCWANVFKRKKSWTLIYQPLCIKAVLKALEEVCESMKCLRDLWLFLGSGASFWKYRLRKYFSEPQVLTRFLWEMKYYLNEILSFKKHTGNCKATVWI